MLIFGRNSVREAILSDAKIHKVFLRANLKGKENQEIIDKIKDSGIEYKFLPKEVLDKKTNGENNQGFVAEISEFEYSDVDEIVNFAKQKGEPLFLCILDGIEDPHNLGSIIRTCECAGVHGIIIEKVRACDVNPTVIKVSAGACNHMKIARVSNIPQTIKNLKKLGVWVYSVELGNNLIYNTNLKGDLAIVIGSEGFGTRPIVKSSCDDVVTLPMFGNVNSLNASNACAIALYEAVRQRGDYNNAKR